jgi:integrase/recombinase XerD
MKVQRVQLGEQDRVSWLVIGDDYLPIGPIHEYLTYLEDLERSPHTIRAYAHHLCLFWQYLQHTHCDWTSVGLSELAEFVSWLRQPHTDFVSLQEETSRRSETTINAILSAVTMLYEYHTRVGRVEGSAFYQEQRLPNRRYKGLLYHISKHKPVHTRLVKLKAPRRIPGTLTAEEVGQLIAACQRLRDKFLVSLLYESGVRVGVALGLRHENIHSWDNVIWVVPRANNRNGARAKTREAYSIPVSPSLMRLYTDYLLHEFAATDSDYVFVNLWEGTRGQPMKYETVADLFRRLGAKTGLAVHPHLLRHTHATDLLRSGMDAAYVQKRLGHASVQTTINTYVHLTDKDLKEAYHAYTQKRTHPHGKEEQL